MSRLGIFDSGLGGLTVLRAIRALLPAVDLLYYADQAHVPYGARTPDELERLLAHNVAYLEARGVAAIVMGCNTSCAIAADRGWPATRVPILDLIQAAADEVAAAGVRRVGIVATQATVATGVYGRTIRARDEALAVQEIAAPALVPLVERGVVCGPIAHRAVAEVCAQFEPIDALVLGCTHYPLLGAEFEAVLGNVRLIDPARAQARRAAEFLRDAGSTGAGRNEYVTTGALEPYRRAAAAIVGSAGPQDRYATAPPLPLATLDPIIR